MTNLNNRIIFHIQENLKLHTSNHPSQTKHLGIVIGPDMAGKTTLFKQSSLNHVPTTADSLEFNSFFNKDCSFLEIGQNISSSPKLLSRVIKTFARHFKRQSIDSIVLCLNIFDCLQQSPKELIKQLLTIKRQLSDVANQLKGVRLFLCFTQLDKVAGFCHSFAESETTWGYSLRPSPNMESLIKQNDEKYRELLGQLHETIIDRLHHTKDPLTRYLIREFPLQMESLGNMVRACLKNITHENITTTAVFFTGAKQGNLAFDRLSANISQTYALTVNSQVPQSSRNTVFFVDGCIEKITQYHNQQTPKLSKKYTAISTAAGLAALSFIGISHLRSSYLLNEAGQELFVYRHHQGQDISSLAQTMTHLHKANQLMKKASAFLPGSDVSKFQSQLQAQYHSNLQNNFLPVIASQLENILEQRLTPSQTYYTLKTYMMLGNQIPVDEIYLSKWLNNFWEKNQIENIAQLNHLLKVATKRPYQGIKLNNNVVINAQSFLQALPEDYLYYNLVYENLPNTPQQLALDFVQEDTIAIPYLFQKQNFKRIYQDLLPALASQLQIDHSVIGKGPYFNPTKTIQAMYLHKYARYWQKLCEKQLPISFASYEQGAKLFSKLTQDNSSFDAIRKLLQENTISYSNPQDSTEKLYNEKIAASFTNLNMFTAHQSEQLKPIFADLAHYFKLLSYAEDKNEVAFNIAKARFTKQQIDPISQLYTLSEELPKPLDKWVEKLGNQTWQVILADAKEHINQQWANNIYQDYRHSIQARYPFDTQSSLDVSEQTFVSFFSSQGRLAQFMDTYVKPFLDTSTPQWAAKTKNGLQLPIHEETITELMRANVIREMFFANGSNQPRVAFSLKPLAFEPMIKSLNLKIAGYSIDESQGNFQSVEVSWPNHDTSLSSAILIETLNGENVEVSESGYWSVFKLLAKANVLPIDSSTSHFQLIFDINDHASKFLLSASSEINPFIPNMLQEFSLPSELA